MRDRGLMSEDAAYYLVAYFLERIVDGRIESDDHPAVLDEISAAMERVERAHGLTDDEYWPLGEEPPEMTALILDYERVISEFTAAVMRSHGETQLATDHLLRREIYAVKCEDGRRELFAKRGDSGVGGGT